MSTTYVVLKTKSVGKIVVNKKYLEVYRMVDKNIQSIIRYRKNILKEEKK